MLVGAFDSVTNLYGRGYVAFVAGNSVNVALSDFGRVINTTKIRALSEKYTQIPAYSFKVFTKDQCIPEIKVISINYPLLIHNTFIKLIPCFVFLGKTLYF